MPGPRAAQNLQMPHPRDWQAGQMPRNSSGGGSWLQLELTDALLKHLDKFKQISGLEINTNKTEALWLGC